MTVSRTWAFNPELDLQFERVVDVPVHLVWAAWTQPEHVLHWFCPKPWTVSHCEIDLRPGGKFNTTMRSPDGELFPNPGCYLEVIPNELIVFTDALLPGFRPAEKPFMTGVIELEALGNRTRYRATAMHSDKAAQLKHEEMGFHGGWGTALDQLVEYMSGK